MERSLLIPAIFFASVPFIASCATGSIRESDQICAEISRFASQAETEIAHAVVLRGGWGGDTKGALMTHDCNYAGYGPGETLCEYLINNTSWEFGANNAKRVSSCLDSPGVNGFVQRVEKYEWPEQATSTLRGLSDKNVQVTVRIERSPSDLSVLTLSAVRLGD